MRERVTALVDDLVADAATALGIRGSPGLESWSSRPRVFRRVDLLAGGVGEVLGPPLRECTRLVGQIDGRSVEEMFGWPDHLKVRPSMTLFAR